MIGTVVSVLIDGTSKKSAADWQGRGEDNRVVNFPSTGRERIGDIVSVEITRAGPHSLSGKIVGSDGTSPLPVFSSSNGSHIRDDKGER